MNSRCETRIRNLTFQIRDFKSQISHLGFNSQTRIRVAALALLLLLCFSAPRRLGVLWNGFR
ncbi:MAG: hypothetical protein DCC68_12285 [Planctomycetota bacterium]|nr:MAG: hypothetical protein DCC68_12285 [Planctomycetota bacterium]